MTKGKTIVSREKSLVKNTAILAIGQLSSKIFTFLLLPVYTSMLTTEDFGTIDALLTIINLVLYFVTLQIENAVFRFVIENRNNIKSQFSYIAGGLVVMLLMSLLATVIAIIIGKIWTIPYIGFLVLALWAQSGYLFVSNLARGLGNNVDYSIASFFVTVSSLVINIVLIVGLGHGASSVLVALICSNIIGMMYLFLKLRFWKLIRLRAFDRRKTKEMLNYSLPLIPNAISWWIANSSDRLLIIYFLGTSFNGIYAAANKIPAIYNTIFSVFNTAWTESVSLSINDEDRNEYINSMINRGFKLFAFLNMSIIICVSIFFKWLIGSNYVQSYNHIFILLIAIFVNSMCSLYGGVLSGLKNTKVIGWTTVVGSVVNAVINIMFIRYIGLYAASISTLIAYIVIYIFRIIKLKKEISIKLERNFLLQCCLTLLIVSIGYFYKNIGLNIAIFCFLIIWGSYHNKSIILPMWYKIKKSVIYFINCNN